MNNQFFKWYLICCFYCLLQTQSIICVRINQNTNIDISVLRGMWENCVIWDKMFVYLSTTYQNEQSKSMTSVTHHLDTFIGQDYINILFINIIYDITRGQKVSNTFCAHFLIFVYDDTWTKINFLSVITLRWSKFVVNSLEISKEKKYEPDFLCWINWFDFTWCIEYISPESLNRQYQSS